MTYSITYKQTEFQEMINHAHHLKAIGTKAMGISN